MKNTIYNKLPKDYVKPQKSKSPELNLVKSGSITEITLGDKKFHVHDAIKMESIISLVEKHDEQIFEISQSNRVLQQHIRELTNIIRVLKSDVIKLQEIVKNNGSFL